MRDIHANRISLSSLLPNFNLECIETLSRQLLRLAVVTEWKTNSDFYRLFMSEEDSIDAQADKFEKDGFFASSNYPPRGKSRLVKWCMFHFMLMVVGTMMLSSMRL